METKKTANEILSSIAMQDFSWVEKFRERQRNEYWIRPSSNIAGKILQRLLDNRRSNLTPSTKEELAGMIDCSEERMNNIVKGHENLDLKTIFDIEKAMTIKLIEIIK